MDPFAGILAPHDVGFLELTIAHRACVLRSGSGLWGEETIERNRTDALLVNRR